jgi:hypothetical protein
MKRLLMGLATLIVLATVTSDAMAQQRQGKGFSGQSLGPSGNGAQTRARNRGQAVQAQRGSPGEATQSERGNQVLQASALASPTASGADLLRMWEEEKLARDVYASLAETSGLPMFRNIVRAENQHMQSLERLISTGGAGGVTLKGTPGEFVFPEYQRLYESLIASGTRSPLDALKVGAKIEEMDIADLQRMLAQTTDRQVQQVLENLMRASHNHLRAFSSQIARQGATYDAEFLTQEEFDQIAESSGQGRGQQLARRGQQLAKRGWGNGGQGSQRRGNGGQQLGPRGQHLGGNVLGTPGRSRQGGGRQRRGR